VLAAPQDLMVLRTHPIGKPTSSTGTASGICMPLSRRHRHSWAFAQLGGFVAYKANRAGVAFVEVDPAYSSQTCHQCGWVDKRNRRSQSEFKCRRCGFVGHADHNAAIVIAHRGVERWGEVMRPYAAPTLAAS
jgi:putative transposase